MTAKLVPGNSLTPDQVREVKNAFIYRYTVEAPYLTPGLASGATQTDAQWIAEHAFYIRRDGHLALIPKYCEPIYPTTKGN